VPILNYDFASFLEGYSASGIFNRVLGTFSNRGVNEQLE
jgi:hypothetical protein